MDSSEHCARIVRDGDRDRYLADLFAPAAVRPHLFALHAFDIEIAGIRDKVSEPTLGEVRLQWWRDALDGDGGGSPVATALRQTIARFSLPIGAFEHLLHARIFDLYEDPMPTMIDLEGYAGDTSSSLMQLAAIILADGRDPGTAELAGHAGVAVAVTGLLRALPRHAARRQCYLPADLTGRHGVDTEAMFAGQMTPALGAALVELRGIVRGHLDMARKLAAVTDPVLAPAFLTIALVEPWLKRMEAPGFDPLHRRADIPPLRRQWLLWRASKRRSIA